MAGRSATIAHAKEMGQVYVDLRIRNFADMARLESGDDPGTVRAIGVESVLADTGATHLCLPDASIRELGLLPIQDVMVATATGVAASRLYGGAMVTVDGRTRLLSCLGLPGGSRPSLGAIAMEELGIELDLAKRTYRLRPDVGPDSYLMA